MAIKRNLFVINKSRSRILVDGGRIADNPWTRLRGLIGVRHLPAGDGLLIRPCKGVHCMFMRIPIDVLYVDGNDTVVAVDAEMAPWAIGRVYRQARYVLELPAGTAAATGTSIGDRLDVRF